MANGHSTASARGRAIKRVHARPFVMPTPRSARPLLLGSYPGVLVTAMPQDSNQCLTSGPVSSPARPPWILYTTGAWNSLQISFTTACMAGITWAAALVSNGIVKYKTRDATAGRSTSMRTLCMASCLSAPAATRASSKLTLL